MESVFYRETLESILDRFGGRHMLSLQDVRDYTGFRDNRTVKRLFPYFIDGYISAETFARCLSSTPPKGSRRRAGRASL